MQDEQIMYPSEMSRQATCCDAIERMLDDAFAPAPRPSICWQDRLLAAPLVRKAGMPRIGETIELWTSSGWKPARVVMYWRNTVRLRGGVHDIAEMFEVEGGGDIIMLANRDQHAPGGWRRDLRNLADLRRQFMIGGDRG